MAKTAPNYVSVVIFGRITVVNNNIMFDIQISNPTAIEIRDKDDNNILEAIQSIFPLENEYCFIIWNHIFIPVCYKYDISFMMNDIIRILNFIKKGEGVLENHWPSNTFSSIWKIECTAHSIKIESTWYQTLGRLTDLLNEHSILEVEKQVFVEKWIALVLFVKSKLEKAGYNSNNLVDFYELENINSYTFNADNFFQ
jgi:hypothetical protein